MKYSIDEVNSILKTLPIGYYLGRDVKVALSDTSNCSFYNPMQDEVTISFDQLLSGLRDDDDNLEETTRGLLYHEISHAFLTPKNLEMTDFMNIFEDERIETLLKNYYLNVNFKKLVKSINGYHGEPALTADQAFYHLVRYRVGDARWLNTLEDLIKKYSILNRFSKNSYSYYLDIREFYYNFINDWRYNHSLSKETEEKKEENEKSVSPNEEENEDSSDEREDDEYSEGYPGEKNDDEVFTHDLAKELINNSIEFIHDKKLNEKIETILRRISVSSKNTGSAINAYSGVFNPRSVARNDYKYFLQQNRSGHQKAFSKIHLNLFIDISGSFKRNEDSVNRLLYALSKFEKKNPDFDYDLITINTRIELKDKMHREIKCYGGNRLTNNLWDIYKKVQNANASNYNIVLFDGDALSDAYSIRDEVKNFRAFDYQNTTIISDLANQKYINRTCKKAKTIFTKDYADELLTNVFNTLHIISR